MFGQVCFGIFAPHCVFRGIFIIVTGRSRPASHAMIERDLRVRDTGLQLPHIKGLSDFIASILQCRSVNTSAIVLAP